MISSLLGGSPLGLSLCRANFERKLCDLAKSAGGEGEGLGW